MTTANALILSEKNQTKRAVRQDRPTGCYAKTTLKLRYATHCTVGSVERSEDVAEVADTRNAERGL